jgi:lycopene beta-cyclase
MTSTASTTDLLIVGAGPAGRMLARAACARSLTVTVVDPSPTRRFEPTYALFADEVPRELRGAVAREWPSVEVRADGRTLTLPEAYVRLDSARAHAALALPDAVQLLTDRVIGATPDDSGLVVELAEGGPLRARRVVDASGHRPVLLTRSPAAHEQIALGATLHGVHGIEVPLFMDFRGDAHRPPSFLYALPLSDEELFVEETVLLTRERPSFDELEARLRRRLDRMGLRGELVVEEQCRIPMDPSVPEHPHLLGFGAAAAMVHPATGYQLGAAAALADPLARLLADTLDQPLERAVADGWALLWPAHRRHTRSMYLFGAEFLAQLDQSELQQFFAVFFGLDPRKLRRYLSHDAKVADVASAMIDVYRRVPSGLRWALTRRGMQQPLPILRPLMGL